MPGDLAIDDPRVQSAEPYLRDILAAFPSSPHSIRLDCDAGLRLPTDELTAVGAVVREAVANALAHAFPVKPEGRVWVRLGSVEERIELTIRDDGTGIGDLDDQMVGGRGLIFAAAERLNGRARMGSAPFGGGAVWLSYPKAGTLARSRTRPA